MKLAIIFQIVFMFSLVSTAQEFINAVDFYGEKSPLVQSTCSYKAIENFILFSKNNPSYLANLDSFQFEETKKEAGAKVSIYAMKFIVSGEIKSMKTKVRSVSANCF